MWETETTLVLLTQTFCHKFMLFYSFIFGLKEEAVEVFSHLDPGANSANSELMLALSFCSPYCTHVCFLICNSIINIIFGIIAVLSNTYQAITLAL